PERLMAFPHPGPLPEGEGVDGANIESPLLQGEGWSLDSDQRFTCLTNPFQHYWEAQSHRLAQGGGLCVNCW
ncbi:MAG: hypothetical protein ACPG5T_07215, partial [Endozoicomonas sp.]